MLSDPFDVRRRIDSEDDARLCGILAMLALPSLHAPDGSTRRRVVEIEIVAGSWVPVDGVSISAGELTFFYGENGTRAEWVFLRAERVPAWRVDHAERPAFYCAEPTR